MTLANKLTILRIILAPAILLLIFYGKITAAIIFIAVAFLTDILDGYAARKLKQKTKTGKTLDAFADKILAFLVIFALLWVFGNEKTNWIYGLMFFSKDILNLIFYISSKKFRESKKHPRILGKTTTLLQAIAIFWIILKFPNFEYLIYSVFAIGIAASIDYFVASKKK